MFPTEAKHTSIITTVWLYDSAKRKVMLVAFASASHSQTLHVIYGTWIGVNQKSLISLFQNMEGVSDFIVGTCKLHPKSCNDFFESKQFPLWSSPNVIQHYFQCGSSVEIYIKPIISCIDDVDFMISNPDQLAFTEDIPVLPDEIRGYLDNIKVTEHTIP